MVLAPYQFSINVYKGKACRVANWSSWLLSCINNCGCVCISRGKFRILPYIYTELFVQKQLKVKRNFRNFPEKHPWANFE